MSQSLHVVFAGASAMSNEEKDWTLYKARLNHLTHLFEKEGLKSPHVEVVGPFSAKTAQEAHRRLETGHTRGKLLMCSIG